MRSPPRFLKTQARNTSLSADSRLHTHRLQLWILPGFLFAMNSDPQSTQGSDLFTDALPLPPFGGRRIRFTGAFEKWPHDPQELQ